MHFIIRFFLSLFAVSTAFANADNYGLPSATTTQTEKPSLVADGTTPAGYEDAMTVDEILITPPAKTECATKAFADALAQNAGKIKESEHETAVQMWIQQTFADKDTLTKVLACPEIAGAAEDETIKFIPIQYKFPGGREIIVNYETQPKVLKQRLTLATKRGLPSDDPNPRIGSADDTAIWTNTDPAWYAIMVTEHGALNEFVGPDKNNTIAINYIKDHIDDFYPNALLNGGTCTSRSALSSDEDMINKTVTKTVNMKETTGEDDTNDYYVAGDINLQWISYLEIALDVVITIVTFGGGTVISGMAKAARASRALKGMKTTLNTLKASDKVIDFVKTTQRIDKLTDEIKMLDKVTDAAKIAEKTKELDKLNDARKTLDKADDVKKYKETMDTYKKLNAYRRNLRLLRPAQRGNIMARAVKATKSAWSGNRLIKQGAKLGRNGKFSGRVRDFLFNSTMRNASRLGKMSAAGGVLYTALKFAGDMYDWTETSTGEFTSGVEFAPLLLLSADDLQGQENVVNHGMWLMWAGDSLSAADDDAAYLQAMDFASKFHEDLMEMQSDTSSPCNVDIFVVRPILRDPGSDTAALYYLVMTDQPWTTAETTK